MIVNDINDDINKTFNKNWQIFASGIWFFGNLFNSPGFDHLHCGLPEPPCHEVERRPPTVATTEINKSTNPINPPCPRLAVWLGRSRRTWCGCRPSPGEGWPWRGLRGWVMGAPWILDEAGWTRQQESACGCCSSS